MHEASTAVHRTSLLRYEPALDGIRAGAVLAVMGGHTGYRIFGRGHIGVDVFFVLSGFLITTLLVREHAREGRISLAGFFSRRAHRLLPALTLLLVVLGAWALVSYDSLPGDSRDTVIGIPASAFYVSAWFRALDINELGALAHTWSLSVEEHFYLLWPFVAIVALRRGRSMVRVTTILLLVAMAWRLGLLLLGADWFRVYAGPDARAEQILAGCLLAVVLFEAGTGTSRRRWLPVAGAASGLALVALVAVFPPRAYLWVGAPVVAALSLLLIAAVHLHPQSRLARLLSHPALAWIGQRSYGLYLWHWPVYRAVVEAGLLKGPARTVLQVTLSFLVAAASYRFVERPMIERARRRGRPTSTPPTTPATSTAVSA